MSQSEQAAKDNDNGTGSVTMIENDISAGVHIVSVQRAHTANDDKADDNDNSNGDLENSKVDKSQSQHQRNIADTQKIRVESVPGNYTNCSKLNC